MSTLTGMFYAHPKVMFRPEFMAYLEKKCNEYLNQIRVNQSDLEMLIPIYKDFMNWFIDQCNSETIFNDVGFMKVQLN